MNFVEIFNRMAEQEPFYAWVAILLTILTTGFVLQLAVGMLRDLINPRIVIEAIPQPPAPPQMVIPSTITFRMEQGFDQKQMALIEQMIRQMTYRQVSLDDESLDAVREVVYAMLVEAGLIKQEEGDPDDEFENDPDGRVVA